MATPRRTRVFPSQIILGTGSRVVSLGFIVELGRELQRWVDSGEWSDIEIRPDPSGQNPFEVFAMVKRSDADVQREQLREFFDALRAAPREGLTPEQIAAIIKSVESIAD